MYFAGMETFKRVREVNFKSMARKSALSGFQKGKVVAFLDQGLSEGAIAKN